MSVDPRDVNPFLREPNSGWPNNIQGPLNQNPNSFLNFPLQSPAFGGPTILRVKKLHDAAIIPTKANSGDLGYDLYTLQFTTLLSHHVTKVQTGIACNFPDGYGALVRDRSSIATKKEVFVVAGVIDNGYTGEIIVAMYNPHDHDVSFSPEEKIAQLILVPVVDSIIQKIEELPETERGDRGFGSSDQKNR